MDDRPVHSFSAESGDKHAIDLNWYEHTNK